MTSTTCAYFLIAQSGVRVEAKPTQESVNRLGLTAAGYFGSSSYHNWIAYSQRSNTRGRVVAGRTQQTVNVHVELPFPSELFVRVTIHEGHANE
jgi:hypothetical protein